jgi:hypothetical protein
METEEIERIKHIPAVEAALDEYAMRIKRWGVDDNTPHQLIEAEDEAIRQIVLAVTQK